MHRWRKSRSLAQQTITDSVSGNESKSTDIFYTHNYDDQRTTDAKAVIRLLRHNKFVSLHGASGIGKTTFLNTNLYEQLSDSGYFPILIRLPTLRYNISQDAEFSLTQSLHDAVVDTWKHFDLSDNCTAVVAATAMPEGVRTEDYVESAASAVDYLQNPVYGFSQFRASHKIPSHVEPVVILDGFDEFFREENELPFGATVNTGASSRKWISTFHEITDVAEQRFGMRSESVQKDNVATLRSNSRLETYSTIICFDEDSFALVKQLALPLPSALRSTYRLKGFTHESAIKILSESDNWRKADGSSYAKAAVILNTLTSSNLSDQRQLTLDKLIKESATRLLSTDGVNSDRLERTVSGSEISLARMMLKHKEQQVHNYGNTEQSHLEKLKRVTMRFIARKKRGWSGKFVYYVGNILRFQRNNTYREYKTETTLKNSGRIAQQFSACISSQVRRDKIGAIVRLFGDSRNNPRSVLVSDARNALARRICWFLLPVNYQFTMSQKKFEQMLDRNPLFQLNESSSGRAVRLTNPLVLRCLKLSYQQQRKRKFLIGLTLSAVLSAIAVYFYTQSVATKTENVATKQATEQQIAVYADTYWSELFDLNAELTLNENPLSVAQNERTWLERRKQELSDWLGSGAEVTSNISSIAAMQLDIYRSESTYEAINNYKLLKEYLNEYLAGKSPRECDERCTSFVQSTLGDSFQYLLLSLSATDPTFRREKSTLDSTQLEDMGKNIRQFCRWGMERMAITITNVPEDLKVTPSECSALYVDHNKL